MRAILLSRTWAIAIGLGFAIAVAIPVTMAVTDGILGFVVGIYYGLIAGAVALAMLVPTMFLRGWHQTQERERTAPVELPAARVATR